MTETTESVERTLERLGAGRAAEVFAWEPGVVLKLARESQFEAGLEREAKALAAAHAAGVQVPEPRGFVTFEGRRGLLMEQIDGRDVFELIEKKPWKVWSLASKVGQLHAVLGRTPAPEGSASAKYHARADITAAEHVPEALKPRLLALLDSLPDGDQLCHMDFHPGNVMLGERGAYIIDFPNSARGPMAADHAKSWVILSAGAPTPDMGRFQRILIAVFRRLARKAYMRGYRKEQPIDAGELAKWKAIQVAVRLREGIAEEREQLLRLLSTSLDKATKA